MDNKSAQGKQGIPVRCVFSLLFLVGFLAGCESSGRSVNSSVSEDMASVTMVSPIHEEVEEEKVFEPILEEDVEVDPLVEKLGEQEVDSKVKISQEEITPQLEEVVPQTSNPVIVQPAAPNSRSPIANPPVSVAPKPQPQQVVPAKPVQPKVLRDVYFALDQATILDVSQPILEANAMLLNTRYKSRNVLLEGHCDERGSVEYNLVLGVRRAQVVKAYLVDLGVSPSRIRIVSYGKERPVCSKQHDACWKKNRRAHIAIQ